MTTPTLLALAERLDDYAQALNTSLLDSVIAEIRALAAPQVEMVSDEMVGAGCVAIAEASEFEDRWPDDYTEDQQAELRGIVRAVITAALNARAGGDDSARLALLLDNQYMTQKLSDTGQWVLLDGQGYLVVSGHYDTARAAIDAALASQAVGVKS